jgi:hypothetical protein
VIKVTYLANAFSLGMLPDQEETVLRVRKVSVEEAIAFVKDEFTSVVGHPGTSSVLEKLLNVPVPTNRIAIKLVPGDKILVFQLMTRLQEGQVLSEEELKELRFAFYIVEV